MWDKQKLKQFQFLRQRELDGVLTEAEQVRLSQMIQEIDHQEATYLRPATKRLRDERKRIEAQNRTVQDLVRRKEILVTRLHSVLDELETEHRAINDALARIIGEGTTVDAGVNR